MILAADVGGTNTRLGLFTGPTSRPTPIARRDARTADFPTFAALVLRFLRDVAVEPRAVEVACAGVAGPVRDGVVEVTNAPWVVRADELTALGIRRALLVNDVVAMAHAVPALRPDDLALLQAGRPDPAGNIALVTLGTGFGSCLLHRVAGRLVPSPAETGHSDLTVRTDREIELLRHLRARLGRADVERVVSGPGLANVSAFTHGGACPAMRADVPPTHVPAAVIAHARSGRCPACREAYELFLDAVMAAVGNFALVTLATGGVFIGGGMAPRVLDGLQQPRMLRAFRARPPMDDLLATMPVAVITDPDAGLLGAAIAGMED